MRSKLFVPASRPELYRKALNSASDSVSFDLEDAVKPEDRPEARKFLSQFLDQMPLNSQSQTKDLIVRINSLESDDIRADLQVAVHPNIQIINLSKVESKEQIIELAERINVIAAKKGLKNKLAILGTIETPKGLRNAHEIAGSSEQLVALQLGFGDLLAPFNITTTDMSIRQYIRLQLKMAAAEHQLAVWDSAWPDIHDSEGFIADAQAAKNLGYTGKSCIHPTQIVLANRIFMPTEQEVEQALAIIETAKNSQHGASQYQGKMIDAPYLAQAYAVVEQIKKYQQKEVE